MSTRNRKPRKTQLNFHFIYIKLIKVCKIDIIVYMYIEYECCANPRELVIHQLFRNICLCFWWVVCFITFYILLGYCREKTDFGQFSRYSSNLWLIHKSYVYCIWLWYKLGDTLEKAMKISWILLEMLSLQQRYKFEHLKTLIYLKIYCYFIKYLKSLLE